MTDVKGRSPRDPNPWYRGSKRFGDLGRHAPPGDDLENTRDHNRIWEQLDAVGAKQLGSDVLWEDVGTNAEGRNSPYEFKIFGDDELIATGDGKIIFAIAPDLNGTTLVFAGAFISTASSSGLVTVQIRNITRSVDMLSTRITINVGGFTSFSATAPPTTPPVINPANDGVSTADLIAVDVDVAGTGAKGLGVILSFI